MKKFALPILTCALVAAAAAAASAQSGVLGAGPGAPTKSLLPLATNTDVTITFTMPQSTDPPAAITYTQNAQFRNSLDDGTMLNGRVVSNGFEVHGAVGNRTAAPGYTPVQEIDFFTTFTGTMQVISTINLQVPSGTGFVPWDVQAITPIAGFAQGFRLTGGQTGEAPLADGIPNAGITGYFGMLNAQVGDTGNSASFFTSSFGSAGFTSIQATPEPGAWAMLGGLAIAGGAAWRRKRKHA